MKKVGLLLLMSSAAFAQDLPYFRLDKYTFSASGKWIPADKQTDKKPFEGVSDIFCSKIKEEKECTQITAQLWEGTLLKPDLVHYKIAKWDDKMILANDDYPCQVDWLVIELGPKKVTLLNVPKGVTVSDEFGFGGLCTTILTKIQRYNLVKDSTKKGKDKP
jgi:hypothetical protein